MKTRRVLPAWGFFAPPAGLSTLASVVASRLHANSVKPAAAPAQPRNARRVRSGFDIESSPRDRSLRNDLVFWEMGLRDECHGTDPAGTATTQLHREREEQESGRARQRAEVRQLLQVHVFAS